MSIHGYSDDEFINDDENVTLISKLDVSNPLHLHPNDSTTLTIISVKLKGTENYHVWSNAMLLALEGRNKTGFIDGSCRISNVDEVLGRQWDRVNAVVLGWILNSIIEELFLGQIFLKRARHVWEELKETYDKVDGSVTFNLHHKIHTLKQNGSTLAVYYHSLNPLWKQFDCLIELPRCTCHGAHDFKKHNQLMKLMQFLMGLDDSYMSIRSSILSKDPLPDVRNVYATISSEESHRMFQTDKCGFNGHTIDRCFKLIGYPTDFGKKRNGQNFKGKSVSNHSASGSNVSSGFTDEQLSTLISLIKDNSISGKNVQANMAGTVVNNSKIFNDNFDKFFCSNANLKSKLVASRKIVDSGANQHMTDSDKGLYNVHDISHLKIKVAHPNGTETFISKIGSLKLPNGLILYDVLVIPEYCVTLISVHKLAKDNKIFVAFDESRCYFLNQDLNLRNVLGIGNQCGGLYYLDCEGINCNKSSVHIQSCLSQHDWHCRLGHPADPVLGVLKPELKIDNTKQTEYCETCQRAKQTREPFPLKFVNQTVMKFCIEKGIIHQTSCAYSPQQNGIAERKHRHLLNVARSLLFQGGIPLRFWTECVLTATYLINRLPSSVLNGKSPFEMIYNTKPNLSKLRVFGCLCFATVLNNHDKLGSRSEKCVMMGYSSVKKGYRLYSLDKHQFIYSRDVKFFETVFPFKDSDLNSSVSGSNVFQDINHLNFFDLDYPEIPSDDPSLCHSGYEACLEKFVGYAKLNTENLCFVSELNKSHEPKFFSKASRYSHWTDAMNKEMEALLRNDTWDLVDLPKDRKAISSKWLWKIKFKSSGEIERYKARLVALGCNQREWIDYEVDFLPVVKMDHYFAGNLMYFLGIDVINTDKFMHAPLKSHLRSAFKILRYLKGSLGLGIHITKASEKQKQNTISKSSSEAEYRALAFFLSGLERKQRHCVVAVGMSGRMFTRSLYQLRNLRRSSGVLVRNSKSGFRKGVVGALRPEFHDRCYASIPQPAASVSSLNQAELAKFAAIADSWKDPFSVRPFEGLKFVDVGCGGGILSEPLARMGASVIGVDAVDKNIKIARLHADLDPVTSSIEYRCTTAENLVEEQKKFDAVLALEVIEHVADPAEFCKSLSALTVSNGATVISTINRSMRAYATAIVAAEYILHWTWPESDRRGRNPMVRGLEDPPCFQRVHSWSAFLTPEELVLTLQRASISVEELAALHTTMDGQMFVLGRGLRVCEAFLSRGLRLYWRFADRTLFVGRTVAAVCRLAGRGFRVAVYRSLKTRAIAGKENGVNILKSIDEGPFQMGTFWETLAEGNEGALHLGPERARVYSDLSPEDKERYNADIRATNILLQGLPKYIYTLINHYTDAKDIWDHVKIAPGNGNETEQRTFIKYKESKPPDQEQGRCSECSESSRIEVKGNECQGYRVQLVMEELRQSLGMHKSSQGNRLRSQFATYRPHRQGIALRPSDQQNFVILKEQDLRCKPQEN
ncbi:ribonuclease H-like domain-containing protein [Tanacetum coccineum]